MPSRSQFAQFLLNSKFIDEEMTQKISQAMVLKVSLEVVRYKMIAA